MCRCDKYQELWKGQSIHYVIQYTKYGYDV
jgi:hypothetical protein